MVNSLPILTTIPTDTWIEADWDNFLTFADDPTLVGGRFYYDQGYMRIEMSPLGSAHGQDNSIVSTVIVLYAAIHNILIKELTNTSFRKRRFREAQPDIAFYIGKDFQPLPRNNDPIDLDIIEPPTLIVEVAASSLEDDRARKLQLYQRMEVPEYWVVDVHASQILAFVLTTSTCLPIRESQVLPGLDISIAEEALQRSLTEDDGAISRWLLKVFSQ